MAAERETVDRLIAAFLVDRIGATFEGRVSGVTKSGLFVRLDETGADGFVPASSLGDEYFRFEEARRAMVGTRTGTSYRLGDGVEVRLLEVAPFAGALRFAVLGTRSRDATRKPRQDRGRNAEAAPRAAVRPPTRSKGAGKRKNR